MDRTKLEHHIKHLEERHAGLEKKIKDGYTHYLTDKSMQKMKFEKAHVKREIEETKTKLKDLA
jgi:hypothetical protein